MYNEPYQTQQAPKKTLRIIVLILIGLVVAGGLGYGGYYFGQQTNKSTVTTQNTNQNQTATQLSYHTIVATGRLFNTSIRTTSKLAIPNSLQGINYDSSIQDPGYTNILANKFNEEVGRWKLGNPTLSQDGYGDISLIHIGDDWLQQTSAAADHPDEILNGLEFTTPAKKAESLASLEKETKDCATNSAKGFVIAKTITICYRVVTSHQSQGVYDPSLYLKGYGVINNQKYVLAGYLTLGDSNQYTGDEADKRVQEIAAGTIPQDTQKLITEYTDALKLTTITSSAAQ